MRNASKRLILILINNSAYYVIETCLDQNQLNYDPTIKPRKIC